MADVYALYYERRPKLVEGDFAVLDAPDEANADGVIVVTSSAPRLLEARRTDRIMHGPFASAEAAEAQLPYSPSIR